MKILKGLRASARALFAHKLRAALALASVAVGVAAVVVTGAIGTGAEREILRETDRMGTNMLVVRPARVKNSASRKEIRGVVTSLTLNDYEAIAELAPIKAAVPGIESTITAKTGNSSMAVRLVGTLSSYMEICRFRLRSGRFIDDDDNRSARRVAVLGARVDQTLFPGSASIGQDLRIRGVPFQIIGVLEAKGVLADGSDEDNRVVIPINTALRRVLNTHSLDPVFISVSDPQEMGKAETEVAELLRGRHRLQSMGKSDDFSIQNKTKMLSAQKQMADSLAMLTSGLAGISLLVGGTGIFALMLMSVKERTGEIGLRMAVGARPRDILVQFLTEAAMLALGGWVAGIAIGACGAGILVLAAKWKVAVSPSLLLASLATVLATGLGFGAYPARKASLIPPIRALKVE